VLYAHHKKLDYFSTECIYSPEAFRGSARTLIKDLEKIRPSSILDIVRSGEDMAKLVPSEVNGSASNGDKVVADDEEVVSGCGSANGRSSGGEMAEMEKQLAQNEAAATQETEILLPTRNGHSVADPTNIPRAVSTHDKKQPRRRKQVKQVMGQCERCGYLSSQKICKACMLLEGLNKSRPRTKIEVGIEDEDSSTTLMRQVGHLEIAKG
jgi:cytoplasmic tRNA 2-thiolation protein 1